MKILKTMEYHLRMLGCIPFELPFWCQKVPVNEIHIGLIFALLIQNLCSTILFWMYEAETYKQRTQSGFFCTRSFLSLVLYARLVWKKNQLAGLVKRLEDIVAKRSQSASIYANAEHQTERFTRRIISILLMKGVPIYTIPVAISSFYGYFLTDPNGSNPFRLIYPAIIPCDWKRPHGYSFAIFLQILTIHITSQILLCVPFIFYGFCKFFVGFVDDIEQSLRDFSKNFVNLKNTKVKNTNIGHADEIIQIIDPKQIDIETNLGEIIAFHVECRQFVLEFLSIYKPFIHSFLMLRTSLMAALLLNVQIAFESRCPYRVTQSLIHFAVWTFLFYFFCNLGEEVGSRFTGISDAIYDCPWHEMPTKLRKCLHVMMCISQKPITLQGNNMLCNRKQFTKIICTAFAYFILFKVLRHYRQLSE